MLAFDATKHAVGLGANSSTLKGLNVQPGSYQMVYQPRDSTRILDAETRWLQDGKVSQWAQNDFSGGQYQSRWEDKSMFHRCQGMLPSKRSPKMLRTCQSLENYKNPSDAAMSSATHPNMANTKMLFQAFGRICSITGNDYLYVYGPSGVGKLTLYGYDVSRAGASVTAAIGNEQLQRFLIGYSDGRVNEYTWTGSAVGSLIRQWQWDNSLKILPNVATTDTSHRRIDALGVYGSFIVVGMKDYVYYFSATSDKGLPDSDGHCTGTPWTYLGDVSGDVVQQFENHRSELYIMSTGSQGYTTYLDMTTLVAGVLPWQQIPYLFVGQALKSYAGRLYLGGAGFDVETGTAAFAQLFELTGNSLRELRVWYDLPDSLEGMDYPGTIPALQVFEGMLYFPDGDNLQAYDFITDSFYTAYTLNTSLVGSMTHLLAVGSNLVAFLEGDTGTDYLVGVPRGNYQNSTCWVETSEFDAEPAIEKRWGFAEIHTRYGAVTLEASLDGGETWASVTRTGLGQAGYKFVSRFDLSLLSMSTSLRLRVTFDGVSYWSSTSYYYKELQEIVVGFILEPPKLREWHFGVRVQDGLALLDGQADWGVDVQTDVDQLHTWYESGAILAFRDRDGDTRQVVLTRLSEVEFVGDGQGRRAVDLSLSLAELSLV